MIEGLRRIVPILNQWEERELLASAAAPPEVGTSPPEPIALSLPFERAVEGEDIWIARAAQMAAARLKHDTLEARTVDKNAPALRGVHGKTHGCVEAHFVVRSDLPQRFACGVFQPGARHRALVRFSNALPGRPDHKPDARGLSIKLLDVERYGRSCLQAPLFNALPAQPEPLTQDFLLVSHPTFFIKDIRDYTLFRGAADAATKGEKLRKIALFFAARPLEAWIFGRTLFRQIDDPFLVEYHSMLSSLLGPRQAVKYVVSNPLPEPAPAHDPEDPNFLREVLRKHLDPEHGKPAVLEFSLVVPDGDNGLVEDPRIDWEAQGAQRIPVARIEIGPQNFAQPSLIDERERLVFNPWHSLEDHKPLGSLSRGRRVVYRASAEMRHALNAWSRTEAQPTAR